MAIKAGVESAHAHFFKGTKLFAARIRGDVRAAKNEFLKAIELDPHFARAYSWLAYVTLEEFQQGWDDGNGIAPAFEAASNGVTIDPDDFFTHWVMATLYIAQKNSGDALVEYDKALDQLASDRADVLAEMADVFSYQGDADRAIELIEEANNLDPKSPKDWYFWSLGFAYFQQRDYANAVAALQRLKDPSNGAYLLLVTSRAKLGEIVPIEDIMARLHTKDPYWAPDYLDRYPFLRREDLQHWLECLGVDGINVLSPKKG